MSWLDVLFTVLKVLAIIGLITVVVLLLTYLERKVLGRFQMRMGPMRTGFHGIFQPIADALKLLLKEDITPSVRDRSAFWIAPIIVFVPAFIYGSPYPSPRTSSSGTWSTGSSTSSR